MSADVIEFLGVDDMRSTGISYRQLDHWTQQGYLRARQDRTGTGHRRRWFPGEREVAELMVRLIEAGLNVETAAKTARIGVDTGQEAFLAPGVVLSWWELS